MRIFLKFKKRVSLLLLIAFIAPFAAAFPFAEKAYAQAAASPTGIGVTVGVPTTESCWTIIPPTITWKCFKDEILGAIGLSIARAAIRTLTDDIVAWINSGFDGNPLFVTNFERFLKTTGNLASGFFLEQMLTPDQLNFICQPFRFEIVANLFATVQYPPRCTFADIRMNVEQMASNFRNFKEGGWAAFLTISTQTNNNAFGTFLVKLDDLHKKVAEKETAAKMEIDTGKGFYSFKKCVKYPMEPVREGIIKYKEDDTGFPTGELLPGAYDPQTGEKIPEKPNTSKPCEEYTNTTPGGAIESQLTRVFGTTITGLELADSFNRIISALLQLGMDRVLRNKGVASYSPQPLPNFSPILEDSKLMLNDLANQIIDREKEYKSINELALETIEGKLERDNNEKITLARGLIPKNIEFQEMEKCGEPNRTDEIVALKKASKDIKAMINESENKIKNVEDLQKQIAAESDPVKFRDIERQIRRIHSDVRRDEEIAAARADLTAWQKKLSDLEVEILKCQQAAA